MIKYFYRQLNFSLFYKVQILLLEIIEVVGEEKELSPEITLGQFVQRMDASYLDGVRQEDRISQLKIYLRDMQSLRKDLKKYKEIILKNECNS